MNTLSLYIPHNKLLAAYEALKQRLAGGEQIIFEAMVTATQKSPTPFMPPSKPTEFAKKLREIDNLVRYKTVLAGAETLTSLVDEICNRILANGGTLTLTIDGLLEVMTFDMNDEFKVRLTREAEWVAQWELELLSASGGEKSSLALPLYKNGWGEIVSFYVIQCVRSAIYSYSHKMYIAALALLSIATEATLRDLLATRGYTFKPGASSVDVYDYARALVDVNGNSYTVTFPDPMPKSPAELGVSTGGTTPCQIKIRREVNHNRGFDLVVRTDAALIEHWSSSKIVQQADKTVGGLGQALEIAREKEKLISPDDLPPDIDDVLTAVRNNLVHLSSEALEIVLPRLAQYSPTGVFKLRDFINREDMVSDIVTNIPMFITDQYLAIRTPKIP